MNRKLKWLIIALLILGALEGLYVVAGNWALRSGFAARLLSRKPARLQVEWASGRTIVPGFFMLEGIKVRGQSERLQSYILVDRCSLRVNVPMLASFRVQLDDVRAEGVSVRVRHRREAGKPRPTDRFEPPIPGLEQDAPPPPRKTYPSPWTIAFGSAKVEDLRELWVGPYKVTGRGRAEGDTKYRLRGALEVRDASLWLEGAKIEMGEEVIASDLRADVSMHIDSVVVREHRGRPFLRNVSGRFKTSGEVTSLGFLNEAMGEHSPLTFNGRGELTADITLERGVLETGSNIAWEGDVLTASSAGFSVGGKGSISGGTGSDRAVSFVARWTGITLRRQGKPPVIPEGSGFTATLSGPRLDLATDEEELTVTLDLPDAKFKDLSVFGDLLPPRAPFSILPGSPVLIRAHWELKGPRAKGSVSVESSSVGLGLGGQALRGPFYAEVKVNEGDIPSRKFDISGSRFGFRKAAFSKPGGVAKGDPWTGEAVVSGGSIQTTDPPIVKAKLNLTMTDTRPVIAVFAANYTSVNWFKALLKIKDIKGGAALTREGLATTVDGVDIQGKGLQMLGRLRLKGGRMDGAFYAQLHKLSAAVLIQDGKRDWKVISARKWYDGLPAK